MNKNIIFVNNYITKCSIGIYPKEKLEKQKVKISVKIFIRKVGNTDKISSTVSYNKILKKIKEITKYEHFNLVETLAFKLASEFEKISNIKKIKIKIVKSEISKEGTDVGFTLIKSVKN